MARSCISAVCISGDSALSAEPAATGSVASAITSIEGTAKLYPEALGSKLGPKLGRYFDNMVSLSVSAGKRVMKTEKDGLLALKTATKVPETFPIETAWVELTEALTGKKVAELLK